MAGVASQSKSLAQNEEFELPPYADEILIVAGTSGEPDVESWDGSDWRDVALSAVENSGFLFTVDSTIFPKIRATDKAITVHYRVSKR
ncbi:MAG: hypothetical protein CMG00_06140 [Candidatus Marinimicrobia bacterium]|nr:hypothetical protein [Candidatus Neomarinimicrobiota bacterium]|tara:strand:- start:776 stop:1039 length:264 start_codon:yes stop_codon:yes gene_type:complete